MKIFGKGCILFTLFLLVMTIQGLALEITDCKVTFTDLQLDKVTARIEVDLKGEGAESVVIGIGSEKRKSNVEEGRATFYISEVKREIGQESFIIKVTALDSFGEALARKNFQINIPLVSLGGTVPRAKENISWMPIQIRESNIAVDGPYLGGYYTFTPKRGWKFVVLEYECQNVGTRPEEAFYPYYGEIAAGGYIYSAWEPPSGILSMEYSPRKSTPQEVTDLVADRAEKHELLPGETARGRAFFEIPENEEPLEIRLHEISPIISLGKVQPAAQDLVEDEMQSLLESLSARYPDLEPDELLSIFEGALQKRWPSWEK